MFSANTYASRLIKERVVIMYKISVALCICIIFCFLVEARGEDEVGAVPAEQEEEKSELAKLMHEIDLCYKAVEEMSGYYKYKKRHWKIIRKSGECISETTKLVREKFSKPEDKKYEDLMKKIQVAEEEMTEISRNSDIEGALEDSQWQVRLLRRTCALCHKHLKIHIYPNLYKKKAAEALEKKTSPP